ncbi:hypothetical protein GPECTOR_60g752 [Gonium pectorale]|uniref:Uncharacterized protein n=1 Tax=Gonium pectorale TaxID=33097 RepID=A0A150G581_GONPE|nr:hypothetical protein GPECTOR_60g752 [Gonium pectorale]|eukprot:KXZ44974.1 hypothetical protein GPECTOR_60g752 [Gonium pectorale]
MACKGGAVECGARSLLANRPHPARIRPFQPASQRSGHFRLAFIAKAQQDDGPSPSAPAPPPSAPPSLAARALAGSPEWAAFLGTLANSGATTGTLLDGIHSRVGLQVYDVAPLVLGGLRTSLLVPPLLAAFYMVLGSLHPIMDNLNPSPETDAARARCNDVGWVALSFGALAALLYTSATLYDKGVPYWQIHAVLGTAALVNWRVFDGTRQGIALALLCGLGAPAAELVLLQLAHLWHYPRADLGDNFVSWVFWCYFFYTPALGNLARYLWSTMKEIERVQQQQPQRAVAGSAPTAAPGAAEAGRDAEGGGAGQR